MLVSGHMYFFNFKGLVEHLRSGRDNERESYYYLLGYVISIQLAKVLELLKKDGSPKPDPYMVAGFAVLGAAIGFFALRALYFANGGDHGKKFVSRLIALTWVATIQYFLVVVLMAVLVYAAVIVGQAGWVAIYIFPPCMLVAAVYFFVKVLNGFKEVNRG